MGVGPWVPKWTYLLDNVTVTGTVMAPVDPNTGVRNPSDPICYAAFELALDANYAHITSFFNGPPPNPNAPGAECAPSPGPTIAIHCEDYDEGITTDPPASVPASTPMSSSPLYTPSNFTSPSAPNINIPGGAQWPANSTTVPNDETTLALVWDPSLNGGQGGSRPLAPNDHIVLTGVWIIENGHPMECWETGVWPFQNRIGAVWPELHPYLWNTLMVVPTGAPQISGPPNYNAEQVSVAAPLYQWVYPDSWAFNKTTNRGNCLFITDPPNPPNIFNSITASPKILAPQLPPGFNGSPNLIGCYEQSPLIGSLGASGISRQWAPSSDGLGADVTVTVTDPNTLTDDNWNPIPNPNDPANGVSIYQAWWYVFWLPRLQTTAAVPQGVSVGSYLNQAAPFSFQVSNVGPDDIQIQSCSLEVIGPQGLVGYDDPAASQIFDLQSIPGQVIPGNGTVSLGGTFTPAALGSYIAYASFPSNDPADTFNGYANLEIVVYGSCYLHWFPVMKPNYFQGVWGLDPSQLGEESRRLTRRLRPKFVPSPDLARKDMLEEQKRPPTRNTKTARTRGKRKTQS